MAVHEGNPDPETHARPELRGFGEKPLAQTARAAASLRRLSALLLSLEHEHDVVDEMVARFEEWEQVLAASAPPDPRPRVGAHQGSERRVYLDHAFDIGSFNPHFPEYEFLDIEPGNASGIVNFPVTYEGPPGLVHGGFLGVFFDCVIQQHNCSVGVAGKTRMLGIRYRRPTPLSTVLDFHIDRRVTEREVLSEARLELDGQVLCSAELDSVATPADRLTTTAYGRRR
ncbi:hypothetical protein [Rhodococcus artemisiae]|uniref:Acyl-coenzyme A thioesterase PaaI-like protein n=1 Tax=Rhodococcus artemisiae TaxID=714159 RepID=A0ABU7LAG3_9NOCA|nr:hypothetical protein [Rhodococcus artemisiae]MEE2058539.1 hypothetical protein [Rhodococcus artemisiae]